MPGMAPSKTSADPSSPGLRREVGTVALFLFILGDVLAQTWVLGLPMLGVGALGALLAARHTRRSGAALHGTPAASAQPAGDTPGAVRS